MQKKLVRDLIPELFPDHTYREATTEERLVLLAEKVVEEAQEVQKAPAEMLAEEAADLQEALTAYLDFRDISASDVKKARSAKARKRGLFEKGWVMTHRAPTKEELAELRKAAEKLEALEAYGVDNWEGYGEAMRSLEDDEA